MRFVAFLPVAAVLSGCAIHPLPEDVATTRNSTYYIVQKIRCETRDAVRANAVDSSKLATLDRLLAKSSKTKPADIKAIEATMPVGLRDMVIGYEFQFTITENDDKSGTAAFAFPFSNGKFSLALGVGENKERKSDRNFIITEKFSELLADPDISDCADSEHWKYPITGKIGMNEVVETYIKLAGLGKETGSRFFKSSKDLGNFVDTLQFTTAYNGSVQPRIDLTPAGTHDLGLTSASASLGEARKDIHKVSIVLTSGRLGGGAGAERGFAAESAPQGASGDAARGILLREQTRGILNDILEKVQ